MATTPFVRVTSREIYGHDISGIQDAITRCEQVLELGTAAVTNHSMLVVEDQVDTAMHRRIYEGTIRGWLTSPAPVIRRGGTIVPTTEYVLFAAQGAIIFNVQQAAGTVITAEFTHVTNVSALTGHAGLTAAHSATAASTANRLIIRDANGRAQVIDGVVAADIATVRQATQNRYARGFLLMGG